MAKILIVDDDESDRLIEESVLTGAGHEVLASCGGEEALRQQLEAGVDLVITDLQMPDVHGFELISIFRDLRPSPPVIAISGTGGIQLHMALQLGAAATVEKPIDAKLLVETVERVLADAS